MKSELSKYAILLSAYACEPNKGSEPAVGWNWAINLSKYHTVFVITRSNNRTSIENYLKSTPNNNLEFYYYDCPRIFQIIKKKIPFGIFIYYKMWQRGILQIAKSIIEENKIDLIHHVTFNEFRTPGYLHKLSKPFIWGPIGGGQFYNNVFKKAMSSYKVLFIERVRNYVNLMALRNKNFNSALKNSKKILIADKSTESILPNKYKYKYKRMLETAYYYNDNYIRKYNDNKDKQLNILWAGNIIPRKGLILLIEALKNIDIKSYKLFIIGSGSEKKYIDTVIEKYNLKESVEFVGKINYNDMKNYYIKSDIFVFTSLRDTSGNVVLEAMSYGLPVIALNHHGVADMVNKNCGTLIDVKSYEQIIFDLRKSIEKYNNNRELIKDHGMQAVKRLKEVYTWEKKMKDVNIIYKDIIDDIGRK